MYILDTQLKDNKIMNLCLKCFFGIGLNSSSKICRKLGLSKNIKGEQLSTKHFSKLNTLLNSEFKLKVSNELKKLEAFRLQKLISIKCYRGLRRIKGLPVRGQRTHTNAKTAKKHRL